MTRLLRDLFGKTRAARHAAPARRLGVECLEDRTVPAAVFHPHFGPETDAHDGNAKLNSPYVYLVFWGADWTGKDRALAATIESQTASLLSSGYFSLLKQYGTDGTPVYGGNPVFHTSGPADPFNRSSMEDVFNWEIDNGGLPHPDHTPNGTRPIYVVVTPPNTHSDKPGDPAGYHNRDFHVRGFPHFDDEPFAWIGGFGDDSPDADHAPLVDSYMTTMSHELAEAMTDYQVGGGYKVKQPGNPLVDQGKDDEIGDFEPDGGTYSYRLNSGVLVQPVWSRDDQAFVARDGNAQNVDLVPYWDSYTHFSTQYDLTVNGDQYGTGSADTITVDTTAAGGVAITLNGERFSFDPGAIRGIKINTGGGSNTVNVRRTSVTVTVLDGGPDAVTIGNESDGVQGINGLVWVDNEPAHAHITIDDAADAAARTGQMGTAPFDPGRGVVEGLAPSRIYYKYADADVTIRTGSAAGTVFNVLATGTSTAVVGAGPTAVHVGDGTRGFAAGVQNIRGALTVANRSSYTTLAIDDTGDTAARAVNLYAWSVIGLAPAAIFWTPDSPASVNGVFGVTLTGSAGGSTYTVLGTSSFYLNVPTTLRTGSHDDTVNVRGTKGRLDVTNTGGADTVTVGSAGWLVGIAGAVQVGGAGTTYLTVDDHADTNAHSPTLSAGTLTGLAPADITWTPSAAAAAGVTSLTVIGGSARSTWTVAGTSRMYLGTKLNTGTGGAAVTVAATAADVFGSNLYVNNGGGQDDVLIGSAGSLAGITGHVAVYGPGPTSLVIDDRADTAARRATLDPLGLSFAGYAAEVYYGLGGSNVTRLQVRLGSGANAVTVADTPTFGTDLYPGDGKDTVAVKGTTGGLYLGLGSGTNTVTVGAAGSAAGIRGLLTIADPVGKTALTIDDSADPTGRAASLHHGSLKGLTPADINYLTSGLSSLTVKAGAGSDGLTLAEVPTFSVTFDGGGGTNTLTGPNADNVWNLAGANAGTVGTVTYRNVQNLTGGAAADVFTFKAGATVAGKVAGGGGADWLDDSAYTTAVGIDLSTGAATGVFGGLAGGVTGVHNARGSAKATNTLTGDAAGGVLVGGAAADTISGGAGRSLLIGGRGADTVTGGAGDDVVVGGFTAYDAYTPANNAALLAVLAEWRSADAYATRVAKIKDGTLAGGATLVAGTTVKDDAKADRLTGGPGQDWFFAALPQDVITDRNAGGPEQVN